MEIKQHFTHQIMRSMSFLVMFLCIAIISYQSFRLVALKGEVVVTQEEIVMQQKEITMQQEEITENPVMTKDCWLIDYHRNKIICQKDVEKCSDGWNEGSPPPPLRCPE